MKKIIALILAAALIFLSGCSVPFNELFQKEGLVEIEGLEENITSISTACKGEKYWLAVGMVCESEEIYSYSLYLINPKTAKVKSFVSLKDCPLEDIFGARYDDDGNILVYNDYTKQCVRYSPKLERISGAESYTPVNTDELGKDNESVDESFSHYDSFAYDYYEYDKNERVNCYAFYDESDKLYFADGERFSPSSGSGKRVLGSLIKDGEYSREELVIYDFSSGKIINQVVSPDYGINKSVCLIGSYMAADSAFVMFEEGSGEPEGDEQAEYKNHYFIWNYNLGRKDAEFEMRTMTAEQIKAENSALIKEIKELYGIDIYINKANQETLDKDEVYALDLTATPYKAYVAIRAIKYFFTNFPENFIKEIYTGMEHIETGGFEIYIAKDIVGFPNAYANTWGEKFEIALETNGFSINTFSHEFMHIIDARLEDYYWEENLDDLWSENNPEGFEYLGYEDFGAEGWEEVDYSDYEDYFVSLYAMSAATEDRADTFSSLFDYGGGDYVSEKPYWYKEGTALAQKAVFLCAAIRGAFPSMKNAPVQRWEKSIAEDLQAKG